ncbi:hypothetical protein BC477_10985 [Clavibacter michiganensis subsp. michiganensis]|uniref:Uncharacterized protein n=1 Tax=Clavibacter michiganensis subsp. michiganensis TaxID=33013 RepID=A0A251XGN1_CLAMM|nr:hypothetical protein BC477_10985 [Clavibacter michiganensis subsp. michiganensis]OUE02318.1 hypothetical protein CMMCAS07_09900 [Clavibacter michiganensis subsp. michiganensis]
MAAAPAPAPAPAPAKPKAAAKKPAPKPKAAPKASDAPHVPTPGDIAGSVHREEPAHAPADDATGTTPARTSGDEA